jgi:signal peptidase
VSETLPLVLLLGGAQLVALTRMHLRGQTPHNRPARVRGQTLHNRPSRRRPQLPSAAPALRLVRVAAVSVAIGVGLGIFGVIVAPSLFGGRALTVMSGSMEPAIGVGDVVINSHVAPAQVRVGDIITFSDPEGTGKLITHRVRRMRIANGTAHVVTKGDNTNAVERWDIPAGGSLGRVEYRVPMLGFLVFWLHGPFASVALIVIPALLLAGFELWRIWRPQRPESLGDAAA